MRCRSRQHKRLGKVLRLGIYDGLGFEQVYALLRLSTWRCISKPLSYSLVYARARYYDFHRDWLRTLFKLQDSAPDSDLKRMDVMQSSEIGPCAACISALTAERSLHN